MRVALVRDLRRCVPCAEHKDDPGAVRDYYPDGPSWFIEGWVATPLPAHPIEPALVPIVTTATEFDPVELARAYIHRWPAQENVIRDWLIPFGLE